MPVHDERVLFEFLILEGARAGLSWDTILTKRECYRAALDGFDPNLVARYDQRRVARLLGDPGMLRIRDGRMPPVDALGPWQGWRWPDRAALDPRYLPTQSPPDRRGERPKRRGSSVGKSRRRARRPSVMVIAWS